MEEDKSKIEAVLNFKAISEVNDETVARNFLSENNWDVTQAIKKYYDSIGPSPGQYQSYGEERLSEGAGYGYDPNIVLVPKRSTLEWLSDMVSSVIPKALKGASPGGEQFVEMLRRNLPDMEMPEFEFGTWETIVKKAEAQSKPLFLYIHNIKNKLFLRDFLDNTILNLEVIPILNKNFIVFGLDSSTKEGRKTINLLGIRHLPHISIRIAKRGMTPITLYTKDTLEISYKEFIKDLAVSLERFRGITQKVKTSKILNPVGVEESKRYEEERKIKEQQKRELEKALECDKEKKKEELPGGEQVKTLEYDEEKKKEFMGKEKATDEATKQREMVKKRASIPPELPATDPEACEIAFQFPSGRRVIRRFPKTTTIEILHNFVDCEEPASQGYRYELSQSFPKRVYSDYSATLAQEGLCPTALLYVVRIESSTE